MKTIKVISLVLLIISMFYFPNKACAQSYPAKCTVYGEHGDGGSPRAVINCTCPRGFTTDCDDELVPGFGGGNYDYGNGIKPIYNVNCKTGNKLKPVLCVKE